jgi:2-methylcitrate dehydratase PrpD
MHTEKLLEFLTSTTLEGLPAPVLDAAKLHVLDTLGIALAATSTPHAPQIAAALDALSEDGNATVIGSTRRRSLSGAILLNGALAHGIDFDDSHKFVHPGCAVIPVALAFAEHYGATGREFLKAVVCGYEMSVRVSLAAGVAHRKRGFHPTGTCNVFGAAIAGGLLAGLDCDQLRAAVPTSTCTPAWPVAARRSRSCSPSRGSPGRAMGSTASWASSRSWPMAVMPRR